MLRFFSVPFIGIEITSRTLKLGAVTSRASSKGMSQPLVTTVPLPSGLVVESFLSPNIQDPQALATLLGEQLAVYARVRTHRVALCLADSVFRVQSYDFDELPERAGDRERLLRWRIEKGAAFDTSNTDLRYQVLPRPGKGVSVLACLGKKSVLSQYEALIGSLRRETWFVGPSSFQALNFFSPLFLERGIPGFAFVWVTDSSYSILAVERGVPRFYRTKDIRQGITEEGLDRVLRDLDDTLHFYLHSDRQQTSEVGHLFLAGDTPLLSHLADALRGSLALEVEVLAMSSVMPGNGELPGSYAPVFGGMA